MSTHSPLARVKAQFNDKASLVAAVEKLATDELWVNRTNKDKGLAHVSNAKLLRLHATFTEVKEKFGTRDKLIDAICEQEKRSKDAGYRQRLTAYPVPRLYDMYKSTAKRLAPAVKKAPKAAAVKAPAKVATKAAPKKAAAVKKASASKAAKKGAPKSTKKRS